MTPTPTDATITPKPNAARCDELGCEQRDLLALVEPDAVDEGRVLCPRHRVAFLREVTN